MELDQRLHPGRGDASNEVSINELLKTWNKSMEAKDAEHVASCYGFTPTSP